MRVGALRTADQQKVEILRAIARDARLIVMDEPTAALTADESAKLLRDHPLAGRGGTSVVLVSHYLEEVLAVSDDVTVMRDGRLVRTGPAREETPESLVTRDDRARLDVSAPPKQPPPATRPWCSRRAGSRAPARSRTSRCRCARARSSASPASSAAAAREVARAIFGADRLTAGRSWSTARPVRIRARAHAARHGIAMLPESRKDQGLLMLRSVRENTTLATSATLSAARRGPARPGARPARASSPSGSTSARPRRRSRVRSLSGGNQQKVLFAKWLASRARRC